VKVHYNIWRSFGIFFVLFGFLNSGFASEYESIDLPSCTLSVKQPNVVADENIPALLFLNGIPESSIIWDPLVEELQKIRVGNPLIQMDLPGTGSSRFKSGIETSFTSQRQCLKEYMDAMGENFIPVIHDIAGPVFIPLIRDSGIPAFILFNTILKPSAFNPPFPMNMARCPDFGAFFVDMMPYWMFRNLYLNEGFGRPEVVEDDLLRRIYNQIDGRQLNSVLQGFELNRTTDEAILAGIEPARPRLVIWGMADKLIDQGQFSSIEPFLSRQDCAYLLLRQAKHFLMVDYAERVAKKISTWLEHSAKFQQ
jgi:pimeloyl-ACP methyl ester carboxylesterase